MNPLDYYFPDRRASLLRRILQKSLMQLQQLQRKAEWELRQAYGTLQEVAAWKKVRDYTEYVQQKKAQLKRRRANDKKS